MCDEKTLLKLREFLGNKELHRELARGIMIPTTPDMWEQLKVFTGTTTFLEVILEHLKARDYDHTEFYNYANIRAQTWSKMQAEQYIPSRDTVSKSILTLKLDVLEAALLMDRAGYTFMWNNQRELAIYFCIANKTYDLRTVDCLLVTSGFKALFSTE